MKTKLQKAVIKQLGGPQSLPDIYNHGADGGFHGFTYYKDTITFFRKNRKEIVLLAEELAKDLGEDLLHMIKGFRCLNDDFSSEEIARALYGPWRDDDAHTMVSNAMSWFALEETAHQLCDTAEE